MKCLKCNADFHYCSSCGYEESNYFLNDGFCSLECLTDHGGPSYEESYQKFWKSYLDTIENVKRFCEPLESDC